MNANARRNKAMLTGWLYIISAAFTIYGMMYLSPKIFVKDDLAATAKNMLAYESSYRLSIITNTISYLLFIVVIFLLYQLFRHIHELMAKLMVVFMFVAMPSFFIDEAIRMTVLQIFKGNLLGNFTPEQAHGIAGTLLGISDYMTQLAVFNWGLWLLPLAWLVYRSGFIPKIFGILLLINGLGYITRNITYFLMPGSAESLYQFIFPTFFLGELPFMFWLVIKGVRTTQISPSVG
jgi:hypothetical protein